jgi:hypothetical protein
MAPATAFDFPCKAGWCAARGLAIIALWLTLLAGFLADVTAAQPPTGSVPCTAAQTMTPAPS